MAPRKERSCTATLMPIIGIVMVLTVAVSQLFLMAGGGHLAFAHSAAGGRLRLNRPGVGESAAGSEAFTPNWVDVPHCTDPLSLPMEGTIAISLYGDNPRYTKGAVRNARLSAVLFPRWVYRMYVPPKDASNAVPQGIIDALVAEGAEIVYGTPDVSSNGMNWRFMIADDPSVPRYMIRDADGRLSPRDKWAVEYWVDSGVPFHTYKDHPRHMHMTMLGGLWGGTHGALPSMREALLGSSLKDKTAWGDDMEFLQNSLVPTILQKGLLTFDSLRCQPEGTNHVNFPYPRAGKEYAGDIVDGDGNPRHDLQNEVRDHVIEMGCDQPCLNCTKTVMTVEGILKAAAAGVDACPANPRRADLFLTKFLQLAPEAKAVSSPLVVEVREANWFFGVGQNITAFSYGWQMRADAETLMGDRCELAGAAGKSGGVSSPSTRPPFGWYFHEYFRGLFMPFDNPWFHLYKRVVAIAPGGGPERYAPGTFLGGVLQEASADSSVECILILDDIRGGEGARPPVLLANNATARICNPGRDDLWYVASATLVIDTPAACAGSS